MTGYPGWPTRGGSLPSPKGQAGRFLGTSDGKSVDWQDVVIPTVSSDPEPFAFAATGQTTQDAYAYRSRYERMTKSIFTTWDLYIDGSPPEMGAATCHNVDGTLRWSTAISGEGYCYETFTGPGALYAMYNGTGYNLLSLDPETGAILWDRSTSGMEYGGVTSGGMIVMHRKYSATQITVSLITPGGDRYATRDITTSSSIDANSYSVIVAPDDSIYLIYRETTTNLVHVHRLIFPGRSGAAVTYQSVFAFTLAGTATGQNVAIDKHGHFYFRGGNTSAAIPEIHSFTSTGTHRWSRSLVTSGHNAGFSNGFIADPRGGIIIQMRPDDSATLAAGMYYVRVNPAGIIDEAYYFNAFTDSTRSTGMGMSSEYFHVEEDWILANASIVTPSSRYRDAVVFGPRQRSALGATVFEDYLTWNSIDDELGGIVEPDAVPSTPASGTVGTLTFAATSSTWDAGAVSLTPLATHGIDSQPLTAIP